MKNSSKYNGKLNVIGNIIRYHREKNNLSLSQLSNRLMLIGIDIPKASIQKIENGNRVIKDYELVGFAKIFKVTPNTLLKDFFDKID